MSALAFSSNPCFTFRLKAKLDGVVSMKLCNASLNIKGGLGTAMVPATGMDEAHGELEDLFGGMMEVFGAEIVDCEPPTE